MWQECNMRDTVTTSWTRLLDESQKHADPRGTVRRQAPPVRANEAQQQEALQDRGGQSALSTRSVRIMIVDEDVKSSSSLEAMLCASGYSETRVAYSGHAALAIAADFHPSMVLLELSLLDMSGYEVAHLLRGRAQAHELRLIALTVSREHAGRERARVAGFERYLLKPVADQDLLGLLS
jgi:CheY-like chemotaxis protein